MITDSQKRQFSDIFEELGKALDITETEYNAIVTSYKAMGNWLAEDYCSLKPYAPEILPQGSFMLGTMVRPVSDEDDLDIDLVCQLKKKPAHWTQHSLKNKVGDRIKEHAKYNDMLDEEGKRCWTLKYGNEKYHMDVLPSFVCDGYKLLLEKSFSAIEQNDVDNLAIRITDKTRQDYHTEVDLDMWHKSNPFGYAKWFLEIASRPTEFRKSFSLSASIAPVPKFNNTKYPLQRVVQILKRHRDIMFDGDCNKPISIIINTLAAKAYRDETNIYDALYNISNNLTTYIENRGGIKWIVNPVNVEENFADKWQKEPVKEQNFYKWVEKLKQDVAQLSRNAGQGLPYLSDSLKQSFGDSIITKTFSTYGAKVKEQSSSGTLKMAATTGILGAAGRTAVAVHNFFGTDPNE